MEDIIHLKHSFDRNADWFQRLSKDHQASYSRQAAHSTACWMNDSTQSLTMTADISKVTCKKCLKHMRLSNIYQERG